MILSIMAVFIYLVKEVANDRNRHNQPQQANEHLWHRLTSFAVK